MNMITLKISMKWKVNIFQIVIQTVKMKNLKWIQTVTVTVILKQRHLKVKVNVKLKVKVNVNDANIYLFFMPFDMAEEKKDEERLIENCDQFLK